MLALGASVVGAQEAHCSVKPSAIALGQTVRLRCDVEVSEAILDFSRGMGGLSVPKPRKVRMFKQADGSWQGLMPIAVEDSPGQNYPIGFDGAGTGLLHVTIKKTIFPTQNVTLAPSIEALHSTPDEMKTLVTFRDAVSDVKYWEEPLVAPLRTRRKGHRQPRISGRGPDVAQAVAPCAPSPCLRSCRVSPVSLSPPAGPPRA